MRELEAQTGVGRETIRFYIREGLLPEPARASRNSASYSAEHVTRLRTIKRLQEERFLPLAVIRNLLDTDDAARWLAPQAFPELDAVLRDRLDHDAPRIAVADLCAAAGCGRDEIERMVAAGVLAIAGDDSVSARDAAIMHVLTGLAKTGFTAERGFAAVLLPLYLEMIEALTTAEVKLFFEQTAGQVDAPQAADMAERGVAGINELLGHLRTRALLAKLSARRRSANDNR